MFNQQSDIITKQEKTQNSIKQDMKNRDLNLEQKDQKLKEFNLKFLQNDENHGAWEKRAQISELKCQELEKCLEQNLFNKAVKHQRC